MVELQRFLQTANFSQNCHFSSETDNFRFFCCAWGVQWTEEEFTKAAVELGHPKSFLKALPLELQSVVENLSTMQDSDIILTRVNWFKRWLARADELKCDEEKLHKSIDKLGAKVVENKRILLFKEMLADAGYYDLNIAEILHEGAPIVGPVQESGHFPKAFKPALISTGLLKEKSADIGNAIIASTASSGDRECDEFVYTETMKEVERGWLRGPLKRSDLESDCSISRRFGLWQKTKYIDALMISQDRWSTQLAVSTSRLCFKLLTCQQLC